MKSPHSLLALIFAIAFISLSCSKSARQPDDSANSISRTGTTSKSLPGYPSDLPQVQIKGVIEDFDPSNRELTVRLREDEAIREDEFVKVTIDSGTDIVIEQGATQASVSEGMKKGQPVDIIGWMTEGAELRAAKIWVGTACKAESCLVKDCRQKCGLRACACPKPAPTKK